MKAIYDIETMSMTGGDPLLGELMLFSAGQQTGKSMLNQMYGSMTKPAKFTILDQALVDGETWYTVACGSEVSIWLREQSEELQYSHIDTRWVIHLNKFDIHEKLYSMMALKWS